MSSRARATKPVPLKAKLRTLLYDIENTPNLGWFYDDKNPYCILETEQQSFIHSVAWQWEGEETIHVRALPDYPLYKRDRKDDYALIKEIHGLFEQADIIIGHNSDNFDNKKVTARLIYHRFDPPPPFKTADTLKLARKIQLSGSNRLDALAKYYNLGAKLPNTGKDLWLPIARGKATPKDWAAMKAYNKHDVYLLSRLWPLLRPWGKTPNLNLLTRLNNCPACGSALRSKRGHVYTMTTEAQRYVCLQCGKWYSDKPEKVARRVYVR